MMMGMRRVSAILLEAAADLPAIELGHHDVEEDHVGLAVPGVADGIGAVAQDGDLVAFLVEIEADQLGDVLLVLDHEDPAEPLPARRAGGLSGGASTLGGGRHLSGRSHRARSVAGRGYGRERRCVDVQVHQQVVSRVSVAIAVREITGNK